MADYFSSSRRFKQINFSDECNTSEESLLSGVESNEKFEEIYLKDGQSKTQFSQVS